MPSVTYIHPNGEQQILDVPVGKSVMQGAIEAGLDGIVAECGGALMCATCHVHVLSDHQNRLPPLSEMEAEMLECAAAERDDSSRLSCQLVVTDELDGLVVGLPETQL